MHFYQYLNAFPYVISGINETNISILRLWGVDIGFEGSFSCLKKSINEELHPEWISSTENEWVTVSPTSF